MHQPATSMYMSMAMASPSSSSSSSSFSSPFLSPPPIARSPLFTPIPEHDVMDEEDDLDGGGAGVVLQPPPTTPAASDHHRSPAPARKHHPPTPSPSRAVSCSDCRPSAREKKATTVVPLADSASSPHTPGVLRSLLSSLTRRTPQREPPAPGDWRRAASELSRKLLHATRRREEAVLEASALKRHMAELERKLSRLESHCAALRAALPEGGAAAPQPALGPALPVDAFLRAVSEARTAVRQLARALAGELRRTSGGGRALERAGAVLRAPPGLRGCAPPSRAGSLVHLEALLSRVFYEDFETSAFDRGAPDPVLDPFERAELNRAAFDALKGLTWDQVLSKGTRHFSEGLSRFCDRKMSDVAATLECVRAWPEPLLHAFFGAAKAVWSVHLLAWSVHPAIPRFQIGPAARFDPVYMDDVTPCSDRGGSTATVQTMVAPGFYVYTKVVRCKVLCAYTAAGIESREPTAGPVDHSKDQPGR